MTRIREEEDYSNLKIFCTVMVLISLYDLSRIMAGIWCDLGQ